MTNTMETAWKIEHVGVVGAGQMGNGIAQVCALAGLNVTMCDQNQDAVDRGLATIKTSLERMQAKDKIDAEQLAGVLGYSPETVVSIEHVARLGDRRTAWDHVHFRPELGNIKIVQDIYGTQQDLERPIEREV